MANFGTGMAVYYLNSQNEVEAKIDWVDSQGNSANTTIVYVRADGATTETGGYVPADDAVRFTLYEDGSLASYRSLNPDGSFQRLDFAYAADPAERHTFGPNAEYSHGEVVYSETLSPTLSHQVKSFTDGKVISYQFSYGTPEASTVSVSGSYNAQTNSSTVTLTNSAGVSLSNSGTGNINGLATLPSTFIGLNGSALIGLDGGTLIGMDGGSLIGNDGSTFTVAQLIGNDGSTLIGNDGSTFVNKFGSLIGNDGSTFGRFSLMSIEEDNAGSEGATFIVNALANFLGDESYSEESFQSTGDPEPDDLAADATTAGTLDLYGDASGTIGETGDRDWIKIELDAGKTYAIQVKGDATGSGTLLDPHLRLYDSAGNLVQLNNGPAIDDDSGTGSNAKLLYTPSVAGTYYIEASSHDDEGTGTYQVGAHETTTAFVKSGAAIINGQVGTFLSEASIAALKDGGYAISFTSRQDDRRPYDSSFHLNVQIIDAQGNVVDLDGKEGYNTFSPDRQDFSDGNFVINGSQIAALDNGGYIISVPDIYALDFSHAGPKIRASVSYGSENGVTKPSPITPATDDDFYAYMSFATDVAVLSNGKYIVSMARDGFDNGDPGSPVQVSINGGTAITIDAETGNPGGQMTSVSALGDGAVVVWRDNAADPVDGTVEGSYGVRGAILRADGSVTHSFDVNATEAWNQSIGSTQAVAELDDGGFVVVWTSTEPWSPQEVSSPNTNVYARVFNSDGTARSDDILLGDDTYERQSHATVIGLPSGGFAVAWQSTNGIRLQQFDEFGIEVGGETKVGDGYNQTMALAPDGKLAIAFVNRVGFGPESIHVQLMEGNVDPTDITIASDGVDENAYIPGQVVGQISVADGNAKDSFTYQILSGKDGASFLVNGNGQLIWNANTLADFETSDKYEIDLKATDSAGRSITKTLFVNVNDKNDPITGLQSNYYTSVDENKSAGTVLATLVAADQDANETFTFTLMNAENMPFSIVDDQLRLTGPIDFETRSYYSFDLLIKDSAGHEFVVEDYQVNLNDLDDTAPSSIQLYNSSIDENLASGTRIGQISGSDIDSYGPGALTYQLRGANANLFQIVEEDGLFYLHSKTVFNHEATETVSVTIRATDPGNRTFDKTLTIDIDDLNEAPVVSGGTTKTVNVNENTTGSFYKIAATDQDVGTHLTYSLASAEGFFYFDLDANGNLSFADKPNFENPVDFNGDGIYEVKVQVSDGENSVYQTVNVKVVDVNEAPTIVTDFGYDTTARNIHENYSGFIASIGATDPENKPLTYSLASGDDSALFSISSTGVLSLRSGLDFENKTDANKDGTYKVTVKVSDGVNEDTQTFLIGVMDRMEAPVITSNGGGSIATISVEEHTTAVTTVKATDQDAGASLTYSIAVSDDQSKFKIDSKTGVLTFISAPDFEKPGDANKNNSYNVKVQVSDGSFVQTQALTVNVTNDNETPAITSNGAGSTAAISIRENATAVTKITATDVDAGAKLTYSLVGGTDKVKFAIDKATGALTFISTPDFEKPGDANRDNKYSVTVQVSDGAKIDQQALTVSVINDNEAPIITSNGGGSTATVSIKENSKGVTKVAAFDVDAGAKLTYSIIGGTDKTKFAIDKATGALNFIAAPDFEKRGDANADNSYGVVVQASDGSKADTQSFTIKVIDVLGLVKNGTTKGETIVGTAEQDILNGKEGADKLIGGNAHDVFVFDTKLGSSNVDTIDDFDVLEDTIRLDDDIFVKVGRVGDLATSAFVLGTKATDSLDRIIYDKTTGKLWYDPDGNGVGTAIQFALLDKSLNVTAANFDIVA